MIAFVSGRVAQLAPDGAVVEVGGVGLSVQCTPGTLAGLRLGEHAHLPTSMVVREESLTLYGFADEDERTVFELLQTASGVGPRLAQAMLAVHAPDALRQAVATEDLAALTQVPASAARGPSGSCSSSRTGWAPPAERPGRRAGPRPRSRGWREQLHGALLGLGWSVAGGRRGRGRGRPRGGARHGGRGGARHRDPAQGRPAHA